jgi:Holliday junction resolvase RusA-like endonuclease
MIKNSIQFIIGGEPVSQIRMRMSQISGARMYDPRSKQKNAIKKIIKKQYEDAGIGKFDHPEISFVFHMPIAKSSSKKELKYFNEHLVKHEKKPDVDNLVKLYLDCLDGICFDGDQKVQLKSCVKVYSMQPKTEILIEDSGPLIS